MVATVCVEEVVEVVYITRKWTRHWVSRARRVCPMQTCKHKESFGLGQFCGKYFERNRGRRWCSVSTPVDQTSTRSLLADCDDAKLQESGKTGENVVLF